MADGRWQMADGRWQMADGRWLRAFDLPVFELGDRFAAEDGNADADLAALGVDLGDGAALVLERAIGNLDGFADVELDLRLGLFLGTTHLGEHGLDFGGPHRDGAFLVAGKADDASG